jgi:hypothetical protein
MYANHGTKSGDNKPQDLKASYARRDDYYAKAYEAIFFEKKSFYWNWPAALFSSLWLLYRRMYFEAFLVALASAVLMLIVSFIPMDPVFFLFVSITYSVLLFTILGLFGTPLYLYCIKKRVEMAKKIPSPSVDDRTLQLALWPSLFGYFLLVFLAALHVISSETELMYELFLNFYIPALALYTYQRARFHDTV